MRHIAVVFTGLVGVAVQHVGHGGPIHLRVARHKGTNWNGTQVVGTYAGQSTPVTAEGRADGVTNEGLGDIGIHVGTHGGSLQLVWRFSRIMQYSACLCFIQVVIVPKATLSP